MGMTSGSNDLGFCNSVSNGPAGEAHVDWWRMELGLPARQQQEIERMRTLVRWRERANGKLKEMAQIGQVKKINNKIK